MVPFGRTVIYTAVDEITRENILDVLRTANGVQSQNQVDIQTLYDFYKGNQPIYQRVKDVRPEINNTIVENRAKEIVDFKVGYLIGEPIQYIGRNDADPEDIAKLNEYMLSEDKDSKDEELVTWQMICGTSYRIVLPDEQEPEDEVCPVEIYTLDPRNTAVVYSSSMSKKPMLAYYQTVDAEGNTVYECYTEDRFYRVINDSIEERPHIIGRIPIIEYPANEARLGAFEVVYELLNAINNLDSNRMDNIEEIVQALVVATNCTFPEGTSASTLRQQGIVELTSADGMEQKIQLLTEKIDQSSTQSLKEDLYSAVLTICAMPNRNGGTSTSDTGIAVIYRDGWSAAETWAKKAEMVFKKSEREFLKIALSILRRNGGPDISFADVDVKFTRRNYEGLKSKAEVLTSLLDNGKIAPRLAFVVSNLFADPEEAYRESLPYIQSEEGLDIEQRSSETNTTMAEKPVNITP